MTDLLPPDDNLTPVPSDQSLTRYQERVPQLLQEVRAISVIDEASYLQICEMKIAATSMLSTLDGMTKKIKAKWKDALESAIQPWDRIAKPLEEAKALAERKRKAYRDDQEKKRKDEELRLAAVAKQKAEDEQLQNALALDALAKSSSSPTVAAAAEAVLNTPVQVAPTYLPPAVPKVKGIRDAKLPKVAVEDKDRFLRALGAALLLLDGQPKHDVVLAYLLRQSEDMVPEAVNAVDVGTAWLRGRYVNQREKFRMPGVKAWME